MSDCRHIEPLLPPFVDGLADQATSNEVTAHLRDCLTCRAAVEAQRTARRILSARGPHLTTTPPGLATRLAAVMREERRPQLGWRGRLSAFAAAAAVVIAIGVGLELMTPQSNVLFAAQLALDHFRCFIVEMTSHDAHDANRAALDYAAEYGWRVQVPPSAAELGLTLVAARRCPFWLGPKAHLLYRTHDANEVSLYVIPGASREAADLQVLGASERIWSGRGASYALVARGLAADELERIAQYLQRATR